MTFKDLINKINRLVKKPIKKPKCFRDDRFMYCYCGKCEPDSYELPSDFKKLLALHTAKEFRNPD